eukprot:g128.t1
MPRCIMAKFIKKWKGQKYPEHRHEWYVRDKDSDPWTKLKWLKGTRYHYNEATYRLPESYINQALKNAGNAVWYNQQYGSTAQKGVGTGKEVRYFNEYEMNFGGKTSAGFNAATSFAMTCSDQEQISKLIEWSYLGLYDKKLRIELWEHHRFDPNRFIALNEIPMADAVRGELIQEIKLGYYQSFYEGERKIRRFVEIGTLSFDFVFQEKIDFLIYFLNWNAILSAERMRAMQLENLKAEYHCKLANGTGLEDFEKRADASVKNAEILNKKHERDRQKGIKALNAILSTSLESISCDDTTVALFVVFFASEIA